MKSNRAYGRHTPTPLPFRAMLERSTVSLPLAVDLRANCGPIKDQGQEGSCTAHAGTSAAEWIYRAYRKEQTVFSPAYLYTNELDAQGSFPQDAGSDGTTLCQQVIAKGLCPLANDPYVPGQIVANTPDQDTAAGGFKLIGAYHGLVGSKTALSVLGDPIPFPVLMGFSVMDDFENCNGVYLAKGNPLGEGHEMVATGGYDVGDTPMFRPANCPPAVLFQNSWGQDWGWDSGYVWVALSVLDDPDTDLKIMHPGKPWA